MKLLIKLAVVALIVNAAWRLGSEYATHYRFADSITDAALDIEQSEFELRQRVLEIAAEYGIPLADDAFTIRRENRHTYVEGSYVKPIAFLPGYQRDWTFNFAADGYIIVPPKVE